MANRWGNSVRIYFLGSKITADGDCSHEIKRCLLLGRKVMNNLDSILKSRHIIFANKGPSGQGYGFSSGHVWMWEFNCEESWAPKNWCFWTVVLEKILESPLDCKEIQQVHPKGYHPGCSLEGLMLKLKLQYFGQLLRRVDSLEKTLMLGGIGGRRRRGWQRMRRLDGITNSMGMSWVNSGSLWWMGGPACCNSWGCKESDTTEWLNWTELNWTELIHGQSWLAGASGKEPTCQCRRHKRYWLDPWVKKIPRRRARRSTPVFLPGESYGQRSLEGYSP